MAEQKNETEQKEEGDVTVTVLQNCSAQVKGRTKQLRAGETLELPAETATELVEAGLVKIAKDSDTSEKDSRERK